MNADIEQEQEMEVLYRRYLAAVVLFHLGAAESVGLGAVDYQASNLLELDGPLSNGELARRLGLSTGAATRLVDRLEAKGLAARTVAPDDRRRAVITHSGALPTDLAATLAVVREPIARVVGSLSDEQLSGLRAYLEAATEAFVGAARDRPAP